MTFDEYNTDDNFDKEESSLEELVKIGIGEGKSSDDIRKSLSPKWQKSKKIGEFDNYIKQFSTTPKTEEEKPTEEKILDKVITASAPQSDEKKTEIETPILDRGEEKYLKEQYKKADRAQGEELKQLEKKSDYNWEQEYKTASKMSDAYRRIDDKMISQLPTFMFKRYQNGEFGEPQSSDAKLRLAHFMINGLGTALSNMGHKINKDGQMEESDFQKYQRTNLEQGLENRWNKYKQETQNAIDLATKEGMKEQDARLAIEQLTRDQRSNTVWNMMNNNQKLYAMEVTKKIGDYLGNMDISELGDFIAGAAYEGYMDIDKVVALGIAKVAQRMPEILEQLPNGNIKDMVSAMISGGGTPIMASFGGLGGEPTPEGNGTTNLTGNLQNYTTVGGEQISFNFNDPNAGKKIKGVYDDLIRRYKNGEIDAETFKQYYEPMYIESKKHPGSVNTFLSGNSDKALEKANSEMIALIDEELSTLNEKAKNGSIKPSEYNTEFNKLRAKASKYGASEKELKFIDKSKVADDKIIKAVDKAGKKK